MITHRETRIVKTIVLMDIPIYVTHHVLDTYKHSKRRQEIIVVFTQTLHLNRTQIP